MRRLFKCWPHFTPRCCVYCALQKQSHTKNAEQPPNAQVAPMSRSSWWGGFAGVVIGAVIDFAAMGFGRTYLVCAVGGGAAVSAAPEAEGDPEPSSEERIALAAAVAAVVAAAVDEDAAGGCGPCDVGTAASPGSFL